MLPPVPADSGTQAHIGVIQDHRDSASRLVLAQRRPKCFPDAPAGFRCFEAQVGYDEARCPEHAMGHGALRGNSDLHLYFPDIALCTATPFAETASWEDQYRTLRNPRLKN